MTRKLCGEVKNSEGKTYEGECACGCCADAQCFERNCPHSEDCRRVAGVDEYRPGEFVWVRQNFMGIDADPRPAQVVKPLWNRDGGVLFRYEVNYMDVRAGRAAAHVNQLRRMTPLEALACQG